MGLSPKIVRWLEKFCEENDVQFTEYSWPKHWGLKVHDFGVRLKTGNSEFIGRAFHKKSDLALVKAFSECFERWVFRKYSDGRARGGIACHTDLREAKRLAIEELAERDTFLKHYFLKVPGEAWDASDLKCGGKKFSSLKLLLRRHGVRIIFRRYAATQASVIACFAVGTRAKKKFGVIVGLALDRSPRRAGEKALLEVLRNLYYVLNSEGRQTKVKRPKTAAEHYEFALDPKHLKYWKFIFESTALRRPPQKSSKIQLSVSKPSKDSPFFLVEARGPDFQNLFFGPLEQKKLNKNALSRFAQAKFDYRGIYKYPHPLG